MHFRAKTLPSTCTVDGLLSRKCWEKEQKSRTSRVNARMHVTVGSKINRKSSLAGGKLPFGMEKTTWLSLSSFNFSTDSTCRGSVLPSRETPAVCACALTLGSRKSSKDQFCTVWQRDVRVAPGYEMSIDVFLAVCIIPLQMDTFRPGEGRETVSRSPP